MTSSVYDFNDRHIVICNWRDSRHPQAGAAELYCEEVAQRLSDFGARVTLLTSRPLNTKRREESTYGNIIRLGGTYSTYVNALAWLLLHRRDIDGVVDSENGIPYFSPVALRRRTPVVLLIHHVHQDQFDSYLSPFWSRVAKAIEKYGMRWVYGRRPVCVLSPSARAEVRRQLAMKGPIFIAPNGLTASSGRARARSPHPRIVCVGRLVRHRRFELIIEAIPSLLQTWPDLEVDFAGDGEARNFLEQRVADYGVEHVVTFHGKLDHASRDSLLSSAWLTVNPSAGEAWGLSVIEAAAQGVPAVAFAVRGLEDSVRHGSTGWLVDDPADLAEVVNAALATLSDPGEAAQWATRCRTWAATFTWESTAARILAVLASEDDRLSKHLDERRRSSDSTTVLDVPRDLVTPRMLERLRRIDQIRLSERNVELLLGSADERDVERALERLGLPLELTKAARVARHYDLMGWLPRQGAAARVDGNTTFEIPTVELEQPDRTILQLRPLLSEPSTHHG